MGEIEIVPTTLAHVERLAENLRTGDICEIKRFGIGVREVLFASYRGSIRTSAAVVDGEVAGIWGVGGCVLGDIGKLWLLTSPVCDKYPLQFALLYRREVKSLLKVFPMLENYVDSGYDRAVKLLEMAGFTLDEPMPFGPQQELFRRFWRTA